jgi:AP-1 complex subunit gamma-1
MNITTQISYFQRAWPISDLVQVTESDAVNAVDLALKRYSADVTTRAMCLVSLLKLSSRFPPTSE